MTLAFAQFSAGKTTCSPLEQGHTPNQQVQSPHHQLATDLTTVLQVVIGGKKIHVLSKRNVCQWSWNDLVKG